MSLRLLHLLTYVWWIFGLAEFLYRGAGAIIEILTNNGITHDQQLWTVFHLPGLFLMLLPLAALTWGVSALVKREINRKGWPTAISSHSEASDTC